MTREMEFDESYDAVIGTDQPQPPRPLTATVEVEVDDPRHPQGWSTYQGIFTTEHAMSSYGLPVLLIGAAGRAVGPAEVRRIYTIGAPRTADERTVIDAARRAGYLIATEHAEEHP